MTERNSRERVKIIMWLSILHLMLVTGLLVLGNQGYAQNHENILKVDQLSDLSLNQIGNCNSSGECNRVMSTFLQGDGSCVKGICQFTQCPNQIVDLVLPTDDITCAPNPFCQCPVDRCGLPIMEGSSFGIFRRTQVVLKRYFTQYITILQGHACQDLRSPGKVFCNCFCGVGTYPPEIIGTCPFSKWWI